LERRYPEKRGPKTRPYPAEPDGGPPDGDDPFRELDDELYAHPIKVIGAQRYRDLDDLIAEARGNLVRPQSAPSSRG
jgi:hypothetical protein